MRQLVLLDLIVEPDEYKVYRTVDSNTGESNIEEIDLPKLSFELLMYLIDHAGKICTVEQISAAVWKNTIVTPETITQRITLLRKSLKDDAKDPKYIESVRGRGYRLLAKPTANVKQTDKVKHADKVKHVDKVEQTDKTNKPSTNPPMAILKQHWKIAASAMTLLCISLFSYWLMNNEVPNFLSVSTRADTPRSHSVASLIERGNYYSSIGQNDNTNRAIDLFHQALRLEPNNEEALIGLSLTLSKLVCRYNQTRDNADQAKQLAIKALAIADTNRRKSKAQAAVAYAWDCLGNLDRALEHYLISTHLDPDNYAAIGSAAHLLETKGELLQAYHLNSQAKRLQPENPLADLQITRILELLKFTAKAQANYQQLFVLYPDNVFINEAYPRFLYFQGRFSEAKNELEKVLKGNIGRYEVLTYYGELIWLLEGKEKSLPWFQTAAKVSASESYPQTVLQLLTNQLTAPAAKLKMHNIEVAVSNGDNWPINYLEASLIALWAMDDPRSALHFLQKAVDIGYLNSEYLTISPLFAPLKEQPEFYQLLDDINQRRENMHQQFLTHYPPPEV
jgi:DNA-binding winged helix-turn-helix (wHTH) protein